MEVDTVSKKNAREKTIARLYELLELQEKVEKRFGIDGYNVFVFGSYVTIHYVEGKSKILLCTPSHFLESVTISSTDKSHSFLSN